MYTVVVADDEQELREAIVSKINWQAKGFSVVGSAENGIEALELVEKLEPDLLLTDIKMPFMTGIELARQVREIRPSIQIAFLSGYDDFEYARQGIQYNIVSYMLKPISAVEMEAELDVIRQKLDEQFSLMRGEGERDDLTVLRRRMAESEFLLPLFLSSSEHLSDEDELQETAKSLGIVPREGGAYFMVTVAKLKAPGSPGCAGENHVQFVESLLNKYIRCHSVFINGRVVSLLVSDKPYFSKALDLALKELMQSAERVLALPCTVGVSRETDSLSYCSGAYYEALTARRYTDPHSSDARFISDQEMGSIADIEYAEKAAAELEQMMKTGDRAILEQFLGQVFNEEHESSLHLLVVQTLAAVYKTAAAVIEAPAAHELLTQNSFYDKIVLHDSSENIRKAMISLCLDTRDIISKQRRQNSQLLCDQALQIIENEYGDENLTLAAVSDRLHVSPNYLSSRITKSGRDPFSTLLTAKRMEEAKNCLLCTSMKILEITRHCGYSDQHYFSYCFKKHFGVSPNKMRESVFKESAEG